MCCLGENADLKIVRVGKRDAVHIWQEQMKDFGNLFDASNFDNLLVTYYVDVIHHHTVGPNGPQPNRAAR
jgi:hypothetical protein